jgi:putative ABC transport system permease protein
MSHIIPLAWKSLLNRRFTVLLTLFAIALSVVLLLGVETVRRDAKLSFANTIAGTDLIVGARSGSIQLLLYSVFRIGHATNNVSWRSYQDIAALPQVAWTIPIMLGDSHRGYSVMGTRNDYFQHYRFARDRSLHFAEGGPFVDLYDAVIGAEVARALDYTLGQEIIVAHGMGATSFAQHDDKPFRVAGILAHTGTPVDRTVHISLEGFEAMHVDWRGGTPIPGMTISADEVRAMELTPRSITAFLVGLESRRDVFRVQRAVNDYRQEPLLAILPGVALQQLWDLLRVAETALLIISVCVVVAGLIGMLAVLLASLESRRRELAILRSVGARPRHIMALLVSEAALLALLGAILGMLALYGLLALTQSWVEARFGLYLALSTPGIPELQIVALVVGAGCLAGLVPAWLAYRYALVDGMTLRN